MASATPILLHLLPKNLCKVVGQGWLIKWCHINTSSVGKQTHMHTSAKHHTQQQAGHSEWRPRCTYHDVHTHDHTTRCNSFTRQSEGKLLSKLLTCFPLACWTTLSFIKHVKCSKTPSVASSCQTKSATGCSCGTCKWYLQLLKLLGHRKPATVLWCSHVGLESSLPPGHLHMPWLHVSSLGLS